VLQLLALYFDPELHNTQCNLQTDRHHDANSRIMLGISTIG